MHSSTGLLALAAYLSTASAATFGFNCGAQYNDDSAKTEEDFAAEFRATQSLAGTNGRFTSSRLFTMLQHGSSSEVIQAIPAAIETQQHLLLGLWASGDSASFQNEVNALSAAIEQYPGLGELVDGISVGSEDLYRISPIGLSAPNAGPGQSPDVLVDYISQVRQAIEGTSLSDVPVGHVDTWTAWDNETNSNVAQAVDFIGTDAYPYWQNQVPNSIDLAYDLFQEALQRSGSHAGNTPIWVTETGWPVSGDENGDATADTESARTYWEQVACRMLADDNMNLWWYTLRDNVPAPRNPSFGVLEDLNGEPVFELSCDGVDTSTPTDGDDDDATPSSSGGSFATSTGGSNNTESDGSSGGSSGPAPTGGAGGSGSGSDSGNNTAPAPGNPSGGAGAPGATGAPEAGSAAVFGASMMAVLGAGIAALL